MALAAVSLASRSEQQRLQTMLTVPTQIVPPFVSRIDNTGRMRATNNAPAESPCRRVIRQFGSVAPNRCVCQRRWFSINVEMKK